MSQLWLIHFAQYQSLHFREAAIALCQSQQRFPFCSGRQNGGIFKQCCREGFALFDRHVCGWLLFDTHEGVRLSQMSNSLGIDPEPSSLFSWASVRYPTEVES